VNVRGDGPLRTGGPVLDYATGMHATSAILAAALMREHTGTGHHVDVAMQDVAMLLLNRNTHIAATTEEAPPPAGNRDSLLLGRYESADGYVMLAGYLPRHWRAICRAVGLAEYAELGNRDFAERGTEIDEAVANALLTRSSADWDAVFHNAGVVAGGVQTLEEVIGTGQPDACELISEVDSRTGPTRVTNAGYLVDGEPFVPTSGPPLLGRHTNEVLSRLGYSTAEVDQLVEDAVVRSNPA
jgi:crotonobetainyl-CoA:carnitine CoA-transferase CaiB-like acyl-CoA transferase